MILCIVMITLLLNISCGKVIIFQCLPGFKCIISCWQKHITWYKSSVNILMVWWHLWLIWITLVSFCFISEPLYLWVNMKFVGCRQSILNFSWCRKRKAISDVYSGKILILSVSLCSHAQEACAVSPSSSFMSSMSSRLNHMSSYFL